MQIVMLIKTDNYQKVRDILLRDDVVSRASMIFKDAKNYGKEGYYCILSGTEEQRKRAVQLVNLKDEKTGEVTKLAEEIEGKEKQEIINKIKEEENRAIEGFGGIFG